MKNGVFLQFRSWPGIAISGLKSGRFRAHPVHLTVTLMQNLMNSGFQDWVFFFSWQYSTLFRRKLRAAERYEIWGLVDPLVYIYALLYAINRQTSRARRRAQRGAWWRTGDSSSDPRRSQGKWQGYQLRMLFFQMFLVPVTRLFALSPKTSQGSAFQIFSLYNISVYSSFTKDVRRVGDLSIFSALYISDFPRTNY